MSRSRRPAAVLLALATLASACKTREPKPPEPLEHPLPYHVAVAPVELPALETLGLPEDEDLWLEFRVSEVTEKLAERLDRSGFTRVSTLASGSGSIHSSEWLDRARMLEADLLLVPKVDYSGDIYRSANELFWLNLPLFLLGGPFCYVMDDQSFETRVTLEAEVYELSWDDTSGSRTVTSLPLRADFDGTTLDFVDRAGGSAGSYATSIVIPAGFLSQESAEAVEQVKLEAQRVLVDELLDELEAASLEFERNTDLAWLEVPVESVEARRLPDGTVHFSASVLPLFAGLELGSYRLTSAGDLLREGELADLPRGEQPGEALLEFELDDVPAGPLRPDLDPNVKQDDPRPWFVRDPRPWFDGTLRLRVTDGRGGARSFTFGIEPVPDPEPDRRAEE